ncbi:hypothetical protein F5Y00DRAFT_227418 [Daldinia vernicosa]|uniref:uncharacterized protein n=1 Tax=Daldinia vernicosa TaxID=114800 RepID=UPI002007B204|nr:uncharacterized protein F5Y00DRAFT_227418 [Daldinia vernicosa]KAI0852160.1 hypothetical protein F5Y00DRAFT_227418 [Daldinia vernicosa]
MTSLSEKGLLGEQQAVYTPTQPKRCIRHRVVEKMPSPRHFFLTLFLGLLVTAGLASAVLHQKPSGEDKVESETEHVVLRDDSTFSRLLSSASPRAIHEFLHAYFPGTYKHGVYDSDHSAMEAIHASDPELATSIVQLAKRQSGNETSTTTATSAESTSAVPTSESESESTTAEEPTSTSTPVDTPTTTTTATSDSTTESTSDVPTTTASDVPTTTTTSTTDDPTTASSATPESSAETTSTPETTLTTATSASTPSTTRPARTSTFTSTLPGGAKTTITSVEVVTPGAPEEASQTSEAEGSLQSGPAMLPARRPVVEVIIGAVVGGALLA